jgi:carbon-monoxide dehydrogenase large subunit
VRRREDPRLVRGRGRFLDDLDRPGQVHAVVVRSPHAHAVIEAVRVPASAPGLLAVLTAGDLEGRARPLPISDLPDAELADAPHPVLASAEVRYVGQPVAVVVAESRALAEDAAELVEVDYAPRPAVVDCEAASEELMRWSAQAGDVAGAFATAAHLVRGRYALPRLIAAPIEPRGALAEPGTGPFGLTVWCSVQDPHRPRAQLSHVLGWPQERIRVIAPDVGGAFGSKGVIAPEIAAIALAALDLGRPVKWVEDRMENGLAAYQGRGLMGDLELALDGDGRMLALRAELRADLGAYLLPTTAIPPRTAALLLTGCYSIPAAAVTIRGLRTHKVPTGPYRGAGRPDAAFLLESLVDDAARALGIDRIELRRHNLIRRFPHRTPLGYTYDSGDYERCLDTALSLAGGAPSPEPPSAGAGGGRLLGRGVALYVERAGGQWESARVSVASDGTVVIASSASPHGQGHDTTFAQIAAERLGIGLERITLRFGDSAEVPAGVGTFGSRSVAMAGSAIVVALDQLVARGCAAAASALGCPPEHVGYDHGRFTCGERTVSLAELAGRSAAAFELGAEARFESEPVFSSGAYVADVAIDPKTGRVEVLALVAVDDAGTVINPVLARGQIEGGVAQAIGECLLEEAVYDADGQLRTASFMDYALPGFGEMPPVVVGEVATPTPLNPLGAKGVGEGGAIGTLPAVANAVADALGGRRLDPPFTPEKVWRALL